MQQSEGGTAGAGNKCSSTKKLEALILMWAETEKGQRWGQKRDRKGKYRRGRTGGTEGEEEGGQIRAAGRFNLTVARIQFSCHHVAD